MSKYLCLCGQPFKRKKDADKHANLFTNEEEFLKIYHTIIKKNWRGRLLDIAVDYPWGRFFRVLGGYMIYMTIVHHFKIDFSIWEATFMGLGLGLYID